MSRSFLSNSQTPQTAVKTHSCIDSTLEYLIIEMVRYYAIGQDHVAAVHAAETMGFRIGSQLAERRDTNFVRLM
jgi:hypothetical protein